VLKPLALRGVTIYSKLETLSEGKCVVFESIDGTEMVRGSIVIFAFHPEVLFETRIGSCSNDNDLTIFPA
jgi:hypothetical protein